MNFIKKIFLTIITILVIVSLSISLMGCPPAPVAEQETIPEVTPKDTIEEAKTTEETTEDQSVDVADIIFYNGIILTLNADRPQEQAIAIKEEVILAVGSNVEILAMQSAETELIDLQGKDTHARNR